MKFKPEFDNVLIERIEEDKKTKGGIIIPDNAKEKPSMGTVIAIPNKIVIPDGNFKGDEKNPKFKVGDIVLFGKWSGTDIKLDGKDYIIIKESNIFGTIEK